MKYVALYERLSRDDDNCGESGSISNQKYYLEKFTQEKELGSFRHFSDDGYSGRTFNRPAFMEMIDEIKRGNISTIVVKDMSRLGRNYLIVGYYTEMFFPKHDVRFIAVNNSIDSENEGSDEFIPFLNIMNDWYSKDTRKKIRTLFDSRMKSGLRCSGSIPYGYYRKSGDKNTYYVDDEAAKVVKSIFKMALDGKSQMEIARTLSNHKILIPSAYQEKYHPENARNHKYKDAYHWNDVTISRILKRQEYTGDMVLMKQKRKNDSKAKVSPIIFENSHEAIIDKETWERINDKKKESKESTEKPPCYFEIIRCTDCGRPMIHHTANRKNGPNDKKYDSDDYFFCNGINRTSNRCTYHYIKKSLIDSLIMEELNNIFTVIIKNPDFFIESIDKNNTEFLRRKRLAISDDIKGYKKDHDEVSLIIKNLYRDYSNGVVTNKQFEMLINEYSQDMDKLENTIEKLEQRLSSLDSYSFNAGKFIKVFRELQENSSDFVEMITDYTGYNSRKTELDYEKVSRLIDKVEIHQGTGRGKTRSQQVDIYFKYIGIRSICRKM